MPGKEWHVWMSLWIWTFVALGCHWDLKDAAPKFGHSLCHSLLESFNNMVKDVKVSYFSNLIHTSRRNSKVLFGTIGNSVTPVHSNEEHEDLLPFFKVYHIRANITLPPFSPALCRNQLSILVSFVPISLNALSSLVDKMESFSFWLNILPTSLFTKDISTTGSCIDCN